MQAHRSKPLPHSNSQRRRAVPRMKRQEQETLMRALAWVLKSLIQHRHRVSLAWVAERAQVGQTTLREYLQGRHPYAWHTFRQTCLAIGRLPHRIEALTVRWLRAHRSRQRRLLSHSPNQRVRYPWESASDQQETRQFKRD